MFQCVSKIIAGPHSHKRTVQITEVKTMDGRKQSSRENKMILCGFKGRDDRQKHRQTKGRHRQTDTNNRLVGTYRETDWLSFRVVEWQAGTQEVRHSERHKTKRQITG